MFTKPFLAVVAALAVVLSLQGATADALSTAVKSDEFTPYLPAGHCLVTSRSAPLAELESSSTRFELIIFDVGQLTLKEHVAYPGRGGYGYPTWEQTVRTSTKGASLCMTASGDLVTAKHGVRLWHSGTAGRARGGRAHLTDSGRLVVQTAAGRVVWSSYTTAVELIAGDRLLSGATLVNRTYPGATSHLEMRSSGDLVLSRNRHVVWHTKTSVRGSHLTVTSGGHLSVITPTGRVVWRSAYEGRYPLLTIAQKGRIVFTDTQRSRSCFVRPSTASHDCGEG